VKKFVFLYYGAWERKPELMQGWQDWFTRVGDRFVDSGNPLGAAREITSNGSRALNGDAGSPLTGYSIVSADSMEDAERLLEGLPIMDSVRIYEAMSM
jgi:hypothetical protein